MSIKFSKYDNSKNPEIDYVWYDSSNVVYSELIDYDNKKKELKIVFGKGQTYLYKDVDVNDYTMFKNSLSNGEAFHKFIKKYPSEKLDNTDLNEVNNKMLKLMNEVNMAELDKLKIKKEEIIEKVYQVSEGMLKVSGVRIYDLEESIIASRNAMRTVEAEYTEEEFELSLERAKKLASTASNSGHGNFLSGIGVSFDVLYPNYWSPEFQRYHFAQIVTSSSKMHKLTKMDFNTACNKYVSQRTIKYMEELIDIYNAEPSYENYMTLLSNCPLGIQLFMRINTNYLQLKNIYHQRKHHKLKEDWGAFNMMIRDLPYFEEFINNNNDMEHDKAIK